MSWLSQRLTPPKSVQKSISSNDIYKGVQNVGKAVGVKDVSMANPLGGANSAANQAVDKAKEGVQAVGGAVAGVAGAFNPMDMFGAGGFGGLMDKMWAREDKQKKEQAAQPEKRLWLTPQDAENAMNAPDRYSDAAQQSAIDRRYQGMNTLAKGQQNAASVGEQNVMSRRLAAMGGLNSGAGMKMLSQQQNLANRRAADQNTQLSIAQSQEKQAATSDNQKLNETSRQFDAEYKLNNQIAEKNMQIADQIAKANSQGMIESLWNGIFGTGHKMNNW
jgi:3-methyladenine DNA glycosylase AlkC